MIRPYWLPILVTLALSGCESPPDRVLGSIERDRISLPAPVFERIERIEVREGQLVAAGSTVLVLEDARVASRLQTAEAEAQRVEQVLAEARSGPRSEDIDAARAALSKANALATDARRERERIDAVVERGVLPLASRDHARSADAAAQAEVRAAQARLLQLQRGTREEIIAQAEAALVAARANAATIAIDLQRTRITAPRAGVIDSLPFKVGDQLPIGTPLATLLVGDTPYARVYVPQPLRQGVQVGTRARITLQGDTRSYQGSVRAIRSEPVFTPYFALTGKDAARLSYLAEIELGADAATLASGLPLQAEFIADAVP